MSRVTLAKVFRWVLWTTLRHFQSNQGHGQGYQSMARPTRQSIFDKFQDSIAELERFGGLPEPHEARAIWDDLWHLEAHHSTALEGNTLVLKEVKALLDSGRAVGAKELKDYMEVQGYGDAAKWVYQQGVSPTEWQHDELIVKTEVRRIHADLMGPVWLVAPHPDASDLEGPGQFRRHEIKSFSGGMTPPSFVQIDSDLSLWVDAVNQLGVEVKDKSLKASKVPERLAEIHRNFEAVHPFIDGNGRTGRLVLNLILIRLGWPPAIIFKKQRSKYLKALDKADKGDMGPLAEQICRSVIDNLHHLIPEIAGPSKFVPLQALQDDTMSYAALRQAAVRGRLEAVQETDGSWRSSRRAVEEYRQNLYSRANEKVAP